MYRNKSEKVQNQQLAVQELTVRTADNQLYATDTGDLIILIGEAVKAVVSCIVVDDSVPGVVVKPAADLSIVDSEAYTAGGDMKAIRIDTLALAANDCVRLQYILA